MLNVISLNDAGSLLTEADLCVPASVAGMILVSGLTGSGAHIIAEAIAYVTPNCRHWRFQKIADESATKLGATIATYQAVGFDNGHQLQEVNIKTRNYFFGELGRPGASEPLQTMKAIIDILKNGGQALASVNAQKALDRMMICLEPRGGEHSRILQGLLDERGLMVIDVNRSGRTPLDVFVKTTVTKMQNVNQ